MRGFAQECQQIAAQLEQINPQGTNPIRTPVRVCRDCGRATTEQYLCATCARDLRERRAASVR